MDPWGSPPLTGYSYGDSPSRTIQRWLFLRNKKRGTNNQSGIPQGLYLWRRPAYQTLLKALYISSAVAWVAPDLLNALVILLNTIVGRSSVEPKSMKPYCKSEKKPYFSMRWSASIFTSFSKILLTTEWRVTGC